MPTGQQSLDPADLIRFDREQDIRREESRRLDELRERDRVKRLADVVNDPSISIDTNTMKAINDPEMVMTSNGDIAKITRRGNYSSQFRRDKILPRQTKRRKNPKLAAAFKQANAKMRTKSGKLRKGKSQADIARLAHRLHKRM